MFVYFKFSTMKKTSSCLLVPFAKISFQFSIAGFIMLDLVFLDTLCLFVSSGYSSSHGLAQKLTSFS